MTSSPSTHRQFKWWLLLLPLTLILAIGYPFSVVTIDTGRDWARAYQIASGQAFPLQGPVLKGVLHFGPLWFYLMGLLLYVGKTVTVTSFLLGILVASKFWLAYLTGKAILDHRYGLLWACALALPAWNYMGQITFTHVNFVEAATLWVIYSLVRYVQSSEGGWLAMALLAFSLALHAHPSTAPLGLLIAIAWIHQWPTRGQAHWRWLLLGLFLFLLPFLPYLVFQYLHGWPDFANALGYAEREISGNRFSSLGRLILGILAFPPAIIENYLIYPGYHLPQLWKTLVLGLFTIGLMGLPLALAEKKYRRLLLLLLGGLLLALLGMLFLRQKTTFYMTYISLPFFAGIWALGSYCLINRLGSMKDSALLLIYGLSLVSFAISTISIIHLHAGGMGSFPAGVFMDIKAPGLRLDNKRSGIRFASLYLDQIDPRLCPRGKETLHLHGAIGLLTDTSYAIGQRLNCSLNPDQLRIGGTGAPDSSRHLAGLPMDVWQESNLNPDFQWGPVGIGQPFQVIHPPQGHALVPLDRFPPRKTPIGPSETREWQFTAECGETLVISNLLAWYMRHQVIAVSANGQPLQASARTPFSTLWRVSDCESKQTMRWKLRISSPDARWLDIFTLKAHTP